MLKSCQNLTTDNTDKYGLTREQKESGRRNLALSNNPSNPSVFQSTLESAPATPRVAIRVTWLSGTNYNCEVAADAIVFVAMPRNDGTKSSSSAWTSDYVEHLRTVHFSLVQ